LGSSGTVALDLVIQPSSAKSRGLQESGALALSRSRNTETCATAFR